MPINARRASQQRSQEAQDNCAGFGAVVDTKTGFAFKEQVTCDDNIATCCIEQNCKHGGTLSVSHVSFLAESFAVGGVVFRRFLFPAIPESSWRQPASQGPVVMETRTQGGRKTEVFEHGAFVHPQVVQLSEVHRAMYICC